MFLVHVSGFPKEERMLVCLRNYLNAAKLTSKYWITEVTDIHQSNLKEVTIEFKSFNDALKAEQFVNTIPYHTQNRDKYNLFAKIIDPQDDNGYRRSNYYDVYQEECYKRSQSRKYSSGKYSSHGHSNDRERSRSPLQDPSKLDLKLELLRKKRLLIEEERRLLLEKKKLEIMKEFGVNACAEFEASTTREFSEEASTSFRDNASREFEKDQRTRDKLLRPHWTKDPGDQARAPPPEKTVLAHIPKFVLPCKIILNQMKKVIKCASPDLHQRQVLTKMISANLRRRFAILLQNKSYMPSDAITKLYRQVYPSSKDNELIDRTLQDVKACHWPKREKSQKTLDKIARKKAEKIKLKAILAAEDGGDKPGTLTDAENTTGTSTDAEITTGTSTDTEITTGTSTDAEITTGTSTDAEITAGTLTNAEIITGTLTDAEVVVNVIPEPNDQEKDVKPGIKTLVGMKTEAIADPLPVKAELNTTVSNDQNAGEDDDWEVMGVDWNDDDDDSKDAQNEN